jgi:HSP20 family protein
MLMRFDPFREFAFRELDRMTQTLNEQGGPQQRTMPIDAYRDGDQFIIRFDLPGVDPDSIDVTADRNVLTVRARREWTPHEGQEVVVTERPQGIFTRQLFLGDNLDLERISATYDQGVLTLMVPVAQQAKPRKVQITTGGTAGGTTVRGETVSSSDQTSSGDTAGSGDKGSTDDPTRSGQTADEPVHAPA